MKAKQVQKTLIDLNLGPTQSEQIFQTSRVTIWRWRQDGTSGANAILLRLLASGKITIQDVEQAHD